MLATTVASADRDRRRGRDTSHRSGGTSVRYHNNNNHRDVRVQRHRDVRVQRHYNRDRYRQPVRVTRRPVYVNNNRFVFHGGVTRHYQRPVIRHRYYNYRVRPQIIVENYDPVPGYIWVSGQWNWNGYEWIWTSGHWAPDPSYQDDYYYGY